MENIPQPASSPYESGDRVRIYLSDDDMDAPYHGLVCEVIEDEPDDLGELTGRDTDSHHYRLRWVNTGKELLLQFRHEDLVSKSEWSVREALLKLSISDRFQYLCCIHSAYLADHPF